MSIASIIGLERPLYGQIARHLVGLRSEDLEISLQEQRHAGERLGVLLRRKGLLNDAQAAAILRQQASWVATATQGDLGSSAFPYNSFLSLCMPAYNEESNIGDTLEAALAILPEFMHRFEVVVVDDGSRDGTAERVTHYAQRDPRVRLVRHERNRGYGAAVTTGMRAAQGDLVAFTDSDGQFSLLDLPQLLTRLEGSDVVVGYRYQRADNVMRRFNAWSWNRLIRFLLGVRIRDLDCAFKLFRREVVDRLHLTATGAAINAEIMVQCCRGGLTIRETPVTHYPRYHGAPTGAALKVIWKAFRELPRLWKYRRTAELAMAAVRERTRVPVVSCRPARQPAGDVAALAEVMS